MPCAKTVNHGLENLPYIDSKLWDSIPDHKRKRFIERESLKFMLLKLANLVCAHADFAKFIYKTLDISSQQNNNNNSNGYMHTKIYNVWENQNIIVFPVCLTLYIYFSLFSYLLESMEFI